MQSLKNAGQKTLDGTTSVVMGTAGVFKTVGQKTFDGTAAVAMGTAGVFKTAGQSTLAGTSAVLGRTANATVSGVKMGARVVNKAGQVVVLDPLRKTGNFLTGRHDDSDSEDGESEYETDQEAEYGPDGEVIKEKTMKKKIKTRTSRRQAPAPPPRIWTPETKQLALTQIQVEVEKLQDKILELKKLQDHNQTFVAARLDADNKIGTVLSMKQVLKFRASITQANKAIAALGELVSKIELDMIQFEYEQKMKEILETPPPAVIATNDEILEEARIFAMSTEPAEEKLSEGLFEA